jgi:hypothetical protein
LSFNAAYFLGVLETKEMTNDFLQNHTYQIIDLFNMLTVLANWMTLQEIKAFWLSAGLTK